jgi:hypothetical protein
MGASSDLMCDVTLSFGPARNLEPSERSGGQQGKSLRARRSLRTFKCPRHEHATTQNQRDTIDSHFFFSQFFFGVAALGCHGAPVADGETIHPTAPSSRFNIRTLFVARGAGQRTLAITPRVPSGKVGRQARKMSTNILGLHSSSTFRSFAL